MLTPRFKPSDVNLVGFPPLQSTLGKVELEFTAAIIVAALARTGNAWGFVTATEIVDTIVALAEDEYWAPLFANPFYEMTPHELVDAGFAEMEMDLSLTTRFCLTPEAIDRLRPWVKTELREGYDDE